MTIREIEEAMPLSPAPEQPVLVVEDDPDSRNIYRLMLEHQGFRVLLAGRGDEALRLARKEHPAVILMDISLPGMNGWEATRILKSDARTAKIPVIALTAHALAEDRARAEEIGFDAYLPKPVEPRTVVRAIREILGLTELPPAAEGSA